VPLRYADVRQMPESTEICGAAENAYNERVVRVENQIIAPLHHPLGTARNANEMFRMFSKFNAFRVNFRSCIDADLRIT
jgi:dynein heavy chain 1